MGDVVVRPSPYLVRQQNGPGRLRKIALIGNARTIVDAPFGDASWEIWAHSSSRDLCPRVDRFFDLHGRHLADIRKSFDPYHEAWLKSLQVPVMMQEYYPDIPASMPYPKGRVMAEFPWRYFTSQVAWMVALALTEGVTHLGFFGIHYEVSTERGSQRPGCEFWMGVAAGRGVQLVIPHESPLLKQPSLLYGYESHDEHGLRPEYGGKKVTTDGSDCDSGTDARSAIDAQVSAAGTGASGEADVLR